MDSEQSYVFDVNGFIVVRSVLTVSPPSPFISAGQAGVRVWGGVGEPSPA